MSLFRRDGEPLKFHLVDIDRDEVIALKELIDDGGGEVADDEETLVKFTSPDASRTRSYVRAKIYDVAFIVESFKEKRFVEPEKYRLGKKIPGDEFIMLHFLYGDCSRACREIESKGNSSQGSIFASQSNNSRRLVISESSDFFATAESFITDEDRFQSSEMNAPRLNPPLNVAQPHRDMSFFFDESQTVVDGLELAMIFRSSLASGDVAEMTNANEDRPPCNLEYEGDVGRKMLVLADERRGLVGSREKLSVQGSPQPQRSSRTVARGNVVENVVTVKQEVPSDTEHTESFRSLSTNQNDSSSDASTIQIIEVKTEAWRTDVEVIEINDSPVSRSSANSGTSKKAASPILAKIVRASNDGESTKVGDIQYEAANNGGERLSESAEKSNLPERREDEATKKICEDRNVGNEKTMEKAGPDEISGNKSDTEARPVTNNSEKEKSAGRRLPPLRKTFYNEIYGFSGSSGSSTDDEPSKSKKSRKRVSLSESGDEVVIIDGDSDEKSEPRRRRGSAEAGPSAVRRELQNHTDRNDESSSTETHRHEHKSRMKIRVNNSVSKEKSSSDKLPNGTEHSRNNLSRNEKSQPHRRKRSDEARPSDFRNEAQIDIGNDESSDEDGHEERKPKIEPGVRTSLSRGAMWRANLLSKVQRNYHGSYRKAFQPPERLKMLRYLIKRNAIHMAKGLIIWTQMIDDGYLTHRTPQSLQNHFIKHILPNIRSIDSNIKSSDMKKFLALKGER